MPRLTFQSGLDGWLILAVTVLMMSLVILFYRQAFAALESRQWYRLLVLRIAAVAIVLLLLFQPVLSLQREIDRSKSVVFAVDRSGSMGIADDTPGLSRWQQARDQVVAWCQQLQPKYDLRIVLFSESTTSLNNTAELSEALATGKATSLSRALVAARQSAGQRPIEAIVLVSDGIHNTAGEPVNVARRLGIPVLTVGTGSPLHGRSANRDVRVTDINCPDQLAVLNKARVTVFVEAAAMAGQVVTVRLDEQDQQVGQQELVLDDVPGSQEVVFEFVPEVKGLRTYTARIDQQSHETIVQNNARSTSALVHEARLRVLYIEGTLRAEYGALVGRFLTKDPDIEFCSLIQTRPNIFTQRSNIPDLEWEGIPRQADQLASFDVFLIGDLDVSFLPEETQRLIHQQVLEGAGLIMIGGYHSLGPGGYADTLIEQLLPVQVGGRDVGQATDPFQPLLTRVGQRHPIFANIADFFVHDADSALTTDLPALGGCVKVQQQKPGATVLLTHPKIQVAGKPMVVMAVQTVDRGRSAVFTGDTTRNWHQTLRAMDRETPFMRFWGQVIRWLAGRSEVVDTQAGMVVTTDRAYYEPEQVVRIQATVRGPQGEAATAATVIATIQQPDGQQRKVELLPGSGPAGHYQAVFEPPRTGRYQTTVSATVGETEMTADPSDFDVGRPNLEFDQLELDESTLVAVAQETGGQYFHISLADRLTEHLREVHDRQLTQYELSVAWPPLMWGMFAVVLSCEWLLRRRYQLR